MFFKNWISVGHGAVSATWEAEVEDHDFKASLGKHKKTWTQNLKKQKGMET